MRQSDTGAQAQGHSSDGDNKLHSVGNYLKFLLPSLGGALFFLLPVHVDGKWTIPMGVLSDGLQNLAAGIMPGVVLAIVLVSFVGALGLSLYKHGFGQGRVAPLWHSFDVSTPWLILRLLGTLVALCIFFQWGPLWLWGERTGHVVFYDLAIPIVTIFIFAGFLLPLLTDYGLMELVGSLLRRPFQFLFGLPGRSSIDCMASWMSAAVVGVLLTSLQYSRGYYSAREAAVISTNFSIVSLPFCLIVAQFVGLDHLFIQYYLTVAFAGILAAIIVPRLPPLSRIADSYAPVGRQVLEEENTEVPVLQRSINAALGKAAAAPGLKSWLRSALANVTDIWFGLMPPLMFIATAGLVIAEYTPVMQWISLPYVPLLELLQVPEAAKAAPALVVGFAEMFLPAVVATGIDSELTRFVIIATSIVQLIYMSEVGVFILKSSIPLNLWQLIQIFVIRTLVTLPVVVGIAHFLVF
jgi:nucleoside recognition membrane protein YjiH